MKTARLAFAICMGCAAVAQADDLSAHKAEAVGIVKQFGGSLKTELLKAIKAGGAQNAVPVCNSEAPGIAQVVSEASGWDVARTSLKLRNPGNQPDSWELGVLQKFEARKAGGEDPKTMAFAAIVEEDGGKVFRFMKAIPTDQLCLQCHGDQIAPEVTAQLDAIYPEDKARGFRVGDIRGAFTLKKRLP